MNLKLTAQALLAGVCSLFATTTQAQTVDLVDGNSGQIGPVLFQWTSTQPTGTGYIDPFVRIQARGVEEGYNTSGRPFPFDEKEPLNYTHDVQMKDLGAGTNINGTIYYQFLLDINEPGNAKALLSLDEIRLYTSTTASQRTKRLDDLGRLIWSSGDGVIMLDAARNSGSGSGDMYMFVPKSLFAGIPENHYFILYSRFGSFEPAKSDDAEAGFEEWAIIFHEEPECPQLAATGGTIDCDTTSVQLKAAITGTGGTFRWTGPNGFTSTAQNPTVTAPGTYTVTHSLNSCVSTSTVTVVDARKTFTVSARGGELTCTRPTIQLSATSTLAGVAFTWSGPGIVSGGNTATPTVGQPGTYTVIAKDTATGCEARATALVTEVETFGLATRGGQLNCDIRTVQLSATASIAGVTFTWTGPGIVSGGTTATPIVNQPGTYQVTARSTSGCEVIGTAVVTDTSRAFTITARGGAITCDRETVQLSVSSTLSGVSYLWTGPGIVSGANTANPVVAKPGTYTVVATDSVSGCKATASSTVSDGRKTFTVTATGGTLNCDRTSVQLTASSTLAGVMFTWTGPGIVSGGTTATPTVSQAGTYTVVAKDTASGCTATATVTVTDTARSFTINARGGELNCERTSVQLSVTSTATGLTYTWTGPGIVSGANTATPTVNRAGTYQVVARDVGGCDAIAVATVTDVRRDFTVSATGGTLTCDRPTVRLTATSTLAGVTFEWSGPGIVSGGNTATPTVNRPGTYTVVAKDATSRCSATATAVVTQTQTQFTVNVTGGILDCIDTTVTLRATASIAGATFRWSGPGIVSGGDTANVVVNQPGTYTVTATVNGCSISSVSTVAAVNTSPDAVPITVPTAQINFKAHSALPNSTFEIELQNVPPGYSISNGKFVGWCIEEDDALMTGVFWPATLHSVGNAPDGWKGYDWRRVNYILNHTFNGTAEDVQKAIWHFVGASSTQPLVLTATAQAIVTEALNNADCYTPEPGDVAGVIIKPVDVTQQTVLLAVPLQPLSPSSILTLNAQLNATGGLNLSFTGAAGKTVVLESSSDLRNWSTVSTHANATGSFTTSVTVDRAAKGKFFRARAQ
ncbi:MAG TPA: hypothetical protein VEH27_00290 [Methylomirabilota bacterium]|nr:hypothetical protein [Methylomirabilota bacterium]